MTPTCPRLDGINNNDAVSNVTRGRRYAFLPFPYDDAATKIREANAAKVEGGNTYRT